MPRLGTRKDFYRESSLLAWLSTIVSLVQFSRFHMCVYPPPSVLWRDCSRTHLTLICRCSSPYKVAWYLQISHTRHPVYLAASSNTYMCNLLVTPNTMELPCKWLFREQWDGKNLYMFSTDRIFSWMFWICECLNPWIQRTNCVCIQTYTQRSL
jgi:hypothetical protein